MNVLRRDEAMRNLSHRASALFSHNRHEPTAGLAAPLRWIVRRTGGTEDDVRWLLEWFDRGDAADADTVLTQLRHRDRIERVEYALRERGSPLAEGYDAELESALRSAEVGASYAACAVRCVRTLRRLDPRRCSVERVVEILHAHRLCERALSCATATSQHRTRNHLASLGVPEGWIPCVWEAIRGAYGVDDAVDAYVRCTAA